MTEGIPGLDQAPTRHGGLIAWVREIAALTRPTRVRPELASVKARSARRVRAPAQVPPKVTSAAAKPAAPAAW